MSASPPQKLVLMPALAWRGALCTGRHVSQLLELSFQLYSVLLRTVRSQSDKAPGVSPTLHLAFPNWKDSEAGKSLPVESGVAWPKTDHLGQDMERIATQPTT